MISSSTVLILLAAMIVTANVASALLVVIDKKRAIDGRRRVPERTLVGWALLGGFPAGIVMMWRARHKTRKRSFQLKYGIASGAHVMAWIAGLLLYQPV